IPAKAGIHAERAATRRKTRRHYMHDHHPSQTLASFAAGLRFEDIPAPVVRRAEDLFLDWFGSALAGKSGRPVQAIESFARRMGPQDGPCEVLVSRRKTSPMFAAMVNA